MALTAPSDARVLRVTTLGPMAVLRDRCVLRLGPLRQRAVLAALIIADGRLLPADRLIDDLWQEAPPRAAAGTLHSYLSNLRRVLEPHHAPRVRNQIVRHGDSAYALTLDRNQVDAWAFEDTIRDGRRLLEKGHAQQASTVLAAALGRWRGEPYQELRAYDFAAREASRLELLRLSAIERRAHSDLAWGRDPDAVAHDLWEPWFRERAQEGLSRALMTALCQGRRFNDALRVFERTRHVLAEELGTDPGPQLRELFTAALRQQAHPSDPPRLTAIAA